MSIKKQIIDWWAGSGESYSSQYQAVLDYATAQGYTKPVLYDRQQEDTFVRLLVSSGVWSLSDQIFNLSAAGDKNFALINLKAPGTRNGTLSATAPKWIKGVGFYGDGSSSYVRTNYVPSTDAVNLTQNNAGVFLYIVDSTGASATAVDFGTVGASGNILASIHVTGNTVAVHMNNTTNISNTNTSAAGRYGFSRSASNATKTFKNGSQVGSTSVAASTAIPNREIYLGAYNNAGTPAGYSVRQFGFWLIGANIDSVIANLDSYFNTYLTTSQAVTSPTFADKTNVNNYLSSTSQLASSFSYGEPSQQLITTSAFDGFGGALASNGKIYCPPGSSTVALKIDTSNQTTSTFGTFAAGTFKYGGAVFANGSVYFIPASSTVVAKVNISTDAVTWFDSSGVKGTESGNLGATTQKWYGGYIGSDGRIYCMPYNATAVMIIDPTTDGIQFLDTTGIVAGPGGNLGAGGKWDGACVYGQYIYGSPSDATDMLKINTAVPSCTRIGSFAVGTSKWAMASLAPNGYLYFFPYFDQRIMKLNPSDDSVSYLSSTIGSTDTNIKVVGSMIMPNGKILLVISTTSITNHYILDPSTDTLTTFERLSLGNTNGIRLASDGSIYSFPNSASTVLQRFYFPRRTISLPDNFTDSNFIKGY